MAALDALLEFTLANTRPDAVVVVLSQVPPGYTRARQQPGRLLYYQVETLIFGRAVERAVGPERFIVGCADPAKPLPAAMSAFLQSFGCPILPMRFESAELCKIAINCCLVSSISVANTLAELCEGIGADWSEIVPALKLDRRIGAYAYLAPGLGIAGGNLERDLATVVRLADGIGSDAGRGEGLDRQQPAPQTLGGRHHPHGRAGKQSRCDGGGLGPRVQREHRFGEKLAVAGDDRGFARCQARPARSGGECVGGTRTRRPRRLPTRFRRSTAPMR